MRHPSSNQRAAALLALATVALTGCIAPQSQCQCPTGGTTSATNSSSAASASNDTKSSAPPSAKPTGSLITDGKSANILNVNPGGSWFAMNDKTAKGSMSPAGTGDFASAITGGAIHT